MKKINKDYSKRNILVRLYLYVRDNLGWFLAISAIVLMPISLVNFIGFDYDVSLILTILYVGFFSLIYRMEKDETDFLP